MKRNFLVVALGMAIPAVSYAQVRPEEKGVLFYLSQTAYLTYFDLFLLALCPFFGALGGFVSRHLALADLHSNFLPSRPPEVAEGDPKAGETMLKRENTVHTFGPNAILVGGVLGIVVALYFVGAITDHVTSLARVFALCILLGYQAPNLWRAQERVIASLVDARLRALLGEKDLIQISKGDASE